MNIKEIPIAALAAIGDAYYALEIKLYLVEKKILKANELHQVSSKYLNAETQAMALKKLIEINFFNEEDLEYIRRGKNFNVKSKAKNSKMITYKAATAFETIIGALYYKKELEKIDEIIMIAIGVVEC